MFVKKDLRKVPQILTDATSRVNEDGSDVITELSFARRAPEFSPGNVSILLKPSFRPALDNLMQLSLYDCGLKSLMEIEQCPLGDDDSPLFPKLQRLDIGRNPLLVNDSLSSTFHTQFPSLLELWCDNCSFGPSIPNTLLQLHLLEVVRMTGNRLQDFEDAIGNTYWRQLKVLALDGNNLERVGTGIGKLTRLEKLHLRQNKLVSLPEGVPSSLNSKLVMISLSSNQLSSLPDSLVDVGSSLKELYLNGNQIQELPMGIGEKLLGLTKLNLAHNKLGADAIPSGIEEADDDTNVLPVDFVERFGLPVALTGNCTKDETCVVQMEGNPLVERRKRRLLEEEKTRAKDMAMEVDEDDAS
ncbi:hypothetical protein HJC23_004130 [Cyclotella cryptica]|uniref:Uncharacterized protein n=1 Tax=Cyclotella cryptica TaxID=29204 RepID=A0ABD3PHP6_9STRA|eukprot:CCRYP_014673-RA/>CCRYP_014673-RA protein AED:0.01 eAED:-0.01 QI:0/-1/0/1/-1/1/1/0/356